MSVSAAMIVKDANDLLHDCIAGLVGQVDEILLVDTGSTDGTLNLDWLERLAAPITLATFKWCDDFSAARNEAVGYCQADWVFIVDADDRLEGNLRKLTDDAPEDVLAYAIPTISRLSDGSYSAAMHHPRLWRNRRGISYRRRVHELPYLPDGSDLPLTEQDQVKLLHVGYDSGYAINIDMAAKRERNRRLVQMGLAEEPNNPRYHFDYARVALGDQDASQALSRAFLALRLWAYDEHCEPREFVAPCLDIALQCAALTGDTYAGESCFGLVPPEQRSERSNQLFARMLIG